VAAISRELHSQIRTERSHIGSRVQPNSCVTKDDSGRVSPMLQRGVANAGRAVSDSRSVERQLRFPRWLLILPFISEALLFSLTRGGFVAINFRIYATDLVEYLIGRRGSQSEAGPSHSL